MKQYKCVEARSHNYIEKIVREEQEDGWQLHTYQAAGLDHGTVKHYLLFEKEA